MSISIGPVTLDAPVILAPLSGISDLPFRRLVKRWGAGMVVSEMIASQAMIRETRQSLLMARGEPEQFPMAVQLAGCEPAVMAEAARLNEDRGASLIDINFGCPVKKVVNGHAGSSLMRDEILAQCKAAMPLDGVLLGLHGAMVAQGYDDVEGDVIARVRQVYLGETAHD